MEDKELDQMLKKALIPNIKDNETKIRFEMEDCVMRKQKKILNPVIALAACAALVIGLSYGNVTEKIIGTHMLSSESDNSATGNTEVRKGRGNCCNYSERTGFRWMEWNRFHKGNQLCD